VLVIDDGSTDSFDLDSIDVPAGLAGVEVLRLGCNLGHQRAIATGLVEAVRREAYDVIVVIDADGEDHPQDIARLLAAHAEHPDAVIVAQRRNRQEAIKFRLSYGAYKVLFRLLTGRHLDFGNFTLLPRAAAERMVLMSELWNHYPATLMRSRVLIERVPIDRQARYAGRSRMNFTSLVNHGLAGIAAFVDTAFARLLVFSVLLTGVFGVLALAGIGVRLITSVPIPGWAALGASVAMIGFIQIIAALVVLSFLTLSARSTSSPPPARFAGDYLARTERVT
jgi:glycosyltransferase involved in cell wall biosynthesis